ncbi:MAG: hypothetical protein WDA71_14045 [Actinomycetota bacterium]
MPAPTVSPVFKPASGIYRYRAQGEEKVTAGSFAPCSWQLETVTTTVHEESDGVSFDTVYDENHKERSFFRFAPDGVWLTYWGAVITCSLAPPQHSEGPYDPPLLQMKLSFQDGAAWEGTSMMGKMTISYSGKVLGRETVHVPAGTFDAWVVETRTDYRGQNPAFRAETRWYVPALGTWVKEKTSMSATRGKYTFHSDYTAQLATQPGPG